MEKISVIIPAYNAAPWLPRCLESVMNQTYRNLEIIVIDDGSTDETGKILDEYAARDSRIVAVHQENAGLVAVREKGITLASGSYVGFVDGDDEIEPDMYERLLENALKYDAEISQCGILYCFYDGRKKPMHGTGKRNLFDTTEGLRELLRGTRMEPSLCNKLYAAHLLKDSCPDATIVNNEDLLRNSVLFARAKKSVFEDFCGYHYWRRADSMSNNNRAVQTGRDVLRARKLILEAASPEVWPEAWGCYANALIGAYNSVVGRKGADAAELRRDCRKELKARKSLFAHLSPGMRYRAEAILALPGPYGIAQRIHTKLLYARIRRQAKQIK